MPYDLYGNSYVSEKDAINAEIAQCAEIDARIANEKISKLENQINNQQQRSHEEQYNFYELLSYCQELEKRILILEDKILAKI